MAEKQKIEIETVIFSVIFPSNIIYFNDFMKSLDQQSNKNFVLFLLNDRVEPNILKSIISQYTIEVKIEDIPLGTSPAKIRELGIEKLATLGYENIIFADTDDMLSINRVAHSVSLLQKHAIICNDLSLINENGTMLKPSVWKSRIDNCELEHTFISDKNILGLGNSAIRLAFLTVQNIPMDIKAVDWFLFSKWVHINSFFFTSDCQTLYRQHTNNTVGLEKPISLERLHYIIDVKKRHYLQYSYLNDEHLDELNKIDVALSDKKKSNTCIEYLKSLKIDFFWWEETNYLNEI